MRPALYAGVSIANGKTYRLHVTSDPAGKLYVEVMAPDSVVFTFAEVSKTGTDKVSAIKALLAHEKFAAENFQTFLKAELAKRVLVAKAPKVKAPKVTKELKDAMSFKPVVNKLTAPKASKADADATRAKNLALLREVSAKAKAVA